MALLLNSPRSRCKRVHTLSFSDVEGAAVSEKEREDRHHPRYPGLELVSPELKGYSPTTKYSFGKLIFL